MKYLLGIFFVASLLFSASCSLAAVKIDTVYSGLFYADIREGLGSDSLLILGKPDKQYCKLSGNGLDVTVAFKKYKSSGLQLIKAGATLLIWGKKETGVDSSSCQVTFWYDDGAGTTHNSGPIVFSDTLNVISVPSQDFNYLEFTLPQDPNGSGKGSKGFYIDAIGVVEDTAAPVKSVSNNSFVSNSLASYPNPFTGSTTIRYSLENEGNTELVITDALGREVERITDGYKESGAHEIPLAIKTPGIYFVRLFVNGQFAGGSVKINSQ